MHLNPAIPLHALDVEILTRLGIAAVLGLLLGLDRELRGNSAGLRTHGLVCFSAALMTVIRPSLPSSSPSLRSTGRPLLRTCASNCVT